MPSILMMYSVCDGELGFFVEHEDEEFGLFGLFLVLVNFVQFVHQFAVSWVVAETDAVQVFWDRISVLDEVVFDL
jgi:hypothetical protein